MAPKKISPSHKPSLENAAAAARARQLVAGKKHGVNWGVLSTISSRLKGSPFGNVVWFREGPPPRRPGTPYFYLSASLIDAAKDPSTSLTVCDDALVTCGRKDTEDRTWPTLTLSGKLVEAKSKDGDFAKAFAKHLNLEGSPEKNGFKFYKLDIKNVFLIDWVGKDTEVPVAEYLNHGKA